MKTLEDAVHQRDRRINQMNEKFNKFLEDVGKLIEEYESASHLDEFNSDEVLGVDIVRLPVVSFDPGERFVWNGESFEGPYPVGEPDG